MVVEDEEAGDGLGKAVGKEDALLGNAVGVAIGDGPDVAEAFGDEEATVRAEADSGRLEEVAGPAVGEEALGQLELVGGRLAWRRRGNGSGWGDRRLRTRCSRGLRRA